MQKIDQISIQKQLSKLNIPYDMNIIREVHFFLDKFIGPLNFQDAQYHVPAACAIICETIKIPTVDHSSFTGTGVKIENVMRHIGNLSKQKFLETIETQIKKSNFSNHSLIQKVGQIKISFRVFKKFKTMFENLGVQNDIPLNINHELLAMFWIIFLTAKYNLSALEDLNLSTKILALVIQEVFCNYYGHQLKSRIRDYISQKDNFAELDQITQGQQMSIKAQIYSIFGNALKRRDPSSTPSNNNLLRNQCLLNRLVDDLDSQYLRIYQQLPENRFVDQMTFLQLTKDLTPQAFAYKPIQKPIQTLLLFDDDENQQKMKYEPNTQQKKTSFKEEIQITERKPNFPLISTPTFSQIIQERNETKRKLRPMDQFTPVSLGHTKSTWARNLIASFKPQCQQKVKIYLMGKNIDYQQFCNNGKIKIERQITQLTKYIQTIQKNTVECLKMSLCLGCEILTKKPTVDLTNQHYFNSLLSISTYLYNSTTRYLSLQLQKYCQEYKADLLDCLLVIYDISQSADLPLFVKQMLEQLEKQVLIKQLWACDRGYRFLNQKKSEQSSVIFNRLDRTIYERIKQICLATKVDLSEVSKIQTLVRQIINKKSQILMRNTLDQIIICSILACLNLNQAKYNLALSTIFSSYNSIPHSMQTNREVVSGNEQVAAPQTLLEFYNKIFIHQVQDMMSKEQQPKYLYTPIRKNHLLNFKNSTNNMSNPFLTNSSRVSKLGGDGGINYQKHIIEKMKDRIRNEEQDKIDEDEQKMKQSPTFGLSLHRKFTFGPGGNS